MTMMKRIVKRIQRKELSFKVILLSDDNWEEYKNNPRAKIRELRSKKLKKCFDAWIQGGYFTVW
jgi:hypothetical protein